MSPVKRMQIQEYYGHIHERQSSLARWHRKRSRSYYWHHATVMITWWATTVAMIIIICAAITLWAELK